MENKDGQKFIVTGWHCEYIQDFASEEILHQMIVDCFYDPRALDLLTELISELKKRKNSP